MQQVRHSFSILLTAALLATMTRPAAAQPATLSVGSALPEAGVSLVHARGGAADVSSLLGAQGTVFIFWSNKCRWTEGYEARVKELHATAAGQGVSVVLVNSNDADAFPEESPQASAARGYALPYVHDTGAVLAKALGAYRTPEVFAFDRARKLVYAGAVDDAPADAKAVTAHYVADFLAGKPPASTKAFGCRIRFPGG